MMHGYVETALSSRLRSPRLRSESSIYAEAVRRALFGYARRA